MLSAYLQLPTAEVQDGGDRLWDNGNAGIRGQPFEIYAAEEFRAGGTNVSDVFAKRKVSSTDKLLTYLLTKPIIVVNAAFDTIKNIQPFQLSDLMNAVGSLGNVLAVSGPAVAKILLDVDELEPPQKSALEPFLFSVYQEEPVKPGRAWRPAPMDKDKKLRRQIALMAALHGLHAMSAVTVYVEPPQKVPSLQATLPARYAWILQALETETKEAKEKVFGVLPPRIGQLMGDMFETLDVPLDPSFAGTLAEIPTLLKYLQSPSDVWRIFVDQETPFVDQNPPVVAPSAPPAFTPAGFAGIDTPVFDVPFTAGFYMYENVLDMGVD